MASSRVTLPRTLWPVIREPAAPGAPAPWSTEPEDATFKLSEPARTLYRREQALIEAWTAAAVNAWPATTMRALAQTLRADKAMVGAKIEAEPLRWPPEETEVYGQRTGMARHLGNRQLSVVLEDAARVAAETNGTAALWTARDGKTVEWTRAREALHAIRET